ncbi:TerC family protein [Desulfolutivibrio sp.]|uniref:TerC family protein n=1 Tax=Desulfolutivibrio sp. TaxID=2773296 RepID=UPI002F96479C
MTTLEIAIAFLTLAGLEIVLGIDNIVFIAIITNNLPDAIQSKARKIGLLLAMGTRIALLFAITWVMRLTAPLFTIMELDISGRDMILLAGGLFLIAKSTFEIHDKIEHRPLEDHAVQKVLTFRSAVTQIALLDIIFSLDSVITAVGMVGQIWIMVSAVVAAVLVMMVFADTVSRFVHRHPTIQMLALSFLILIGVFLVAEGLGKHIDRGYIYFAMFFSLLVEFLNMRMRKTQAS